MYRMQAYFSYSFGAALHTLGLNDVFCVGSILLMLLFITFCFLAADSCSSMDGCFNENSLLFSSCIPYVPFRRLRTFRMQVGRVPQFPQ